MVQCVMWIVQYFLKQLIVSVLEELTEVWHVRWVTVFRYVTSQLGRINLPPSARQ